MKVSKSKNTITLSKKDTSRWFKDPKFRDEVCMLAAELLKDQTPARENGSAVIVNCSDSWVVPVASFYVRTRP